MSRHAAQQQQQQQLVFEQQRHFQCHWIPAVSCSSSLTMLRSSSGSAYNRHTSARRAR
jgi:hypothetical protein